MPRIKIINGPREVKGVDPVKVNHTLKPVKREDSNLEAELGEIAITNLTFDGIPELYKIGGERHSENGTPLNLPENSFIFSRDKSMRIKDETIQKMFGKKAKKKGYDPAEIAKQYDINDYRKILADPNSDTMQRETAELMIKNYNEKLGKLALVQESKKGFSGGVPYISIPYLEDMGIDPAQFVSGTGRDEAEVATEAEEDVQIAKTGGSVKVRILKKPSYQKGGPVKDDKEFAFNQEFYDSFSQRLGDDMTGALSPFMIDSRGMVPEKQRSMGSAYGRQDWTSAELFPDFRNRNAWYFQSHPDFNPKRKEDVESFQKAYNAKAEGMGLPAYFTPKQGSKYSVDGKFGEVTFSTPNLDYVSPAKTVQTFQASEPSLGTTPAALPVKRLQQPKVADPNNPFWTQDIINTLGAAGDYNRIKKYLPWNAGFETLLPDANYFDPTRELAANAEQSNIAAQTLGAFAGPQQLNARLGEVQGKALANAANILGKYNNMNVAQANQTEQNRINILNEASRVRSGQNTELYDKTVIANQSFDNARNQARQNLRQSFVNAYTNRGRTQALNSINKQYRVDPRTGFVQFTGVQGQLNPDQPQNDILDYYNTLMQNPNIRANPEHANNLLKLYAKGLGVELNDEIDQRYLQQYYQNK